MAHELKMGVCSDIRKIHDGVDLVIVAVPDSYISSAADYISKDAFVVHPSGAVELDALPQTRRGVLWGCYSFVKHHTIQYNKVPFCIEAANPMDLILLENWIKPIQGPIFKVNSEERKQAHLAAVFANNFTTHLWSTAAQVIGKVNLPFDILAPTLLQLSQTIQEHSPELLQTGPAKRGDHETLQKHLHMLDDTPELAEIYLQMTNRILKEYGHTEL